MESNTFLNERIERFAFDVSGGTHTGTAGEKTLGYIPGKAVITQAWIHVETTFESENDSATIALGRTNDTDAFDAAVSISTGTTWDAAAPRVSDNAADGAVGNFIRVDQSSDEAILATVAVETITAGKLYVYVKYYVED